MSMFSNLSFIYKDIHFGTDCLTLSYRLTQKIPRIQEFVENITFSPML
jgi:hypothetical protein